MKKKEVFRGKKQKKSMACSIELTHKAARDFSCLDKKTKTKVGAVIDMLVDFSPNVPLDIRKLKTPFEGYRVRVGNYRILFVVNKKHITIYSIKHRKDAYK